MTTLKLYKGVDFDGVNSFPDIPTKAAFDTYLAGKQQYSQSVQYNRIGDPILIQKGYDVAISYSYGCIDTGAKKYFIIPDAVTVNENGRVYLSYSVDWYTTLKYDSKISFGRAHLIKSTGVNPLSYSQSIQPIDMRVSSVIPFDTSLGNLTNVGEIHVAYTTADASSKVKWTLHRVENGMSIVDSVLVIGEDHIVTNTSGFTIGVSQIMNGFLYSVCGIAPANVLGIYYIPYPCSDTQYQGAYLGKSKKVGDVTYIWYELDELFHTPPVSRKNMDINLTSTTMHTVHLIDRYGGIFYSVPYGRTLRRIVYKPVMTASACYIAAEFFYDTLPASTTDPSSEKSAENSFVLYMCEKIDYNNDSYANWASGLKGVEIEERRLQKNKALVSNLSGTAVTTAIGAGTAGPVGAAVGAVGSIASALASYGIDTYYESDINRLEDRKYQLTQDTMVPGGFLSRLYPTLAIVVLSASPSDIARYDAEIDNFGADCNLPLASWTPAPGSYKFADVEVITDTPYSIKQGIRQKLLSGIKIVDVT